ncbi:MAG: hypothetical protein ACRDDY_15525 [Clostridium sp.]
MYKHNDPFGNNVCEQIENELKQVVDREIILEQIPHPHLAISVVYPERHLITGEITYIKLREVDVKDSLTNTNEMKIDYRTGKITLHHSLEGKYLNASYWGVGYNLIHSSRVYTKLDENGDIVQTLEDLIQVIHSLGDIDMMLSILQDVQNAKKSIPNDVTYKDISDRLNNIELTIKGYLQDHIDVNNKIVDATIKINDVETIAKDVDYRMEILENNYLNPNVVSNREIDDIIGRLV